MEFKSYVMLAMSAALAVLVSYNTPAMADDYASKNPDAIPPSETLQSYPNDANIGALQQSAENNKPYGSADYNAAMAEQGFPDTATGDDDY